MKRVDPIGFLHPDVQTRIRAIKRDNPGWSWHLCLYWQWRSTHRCVACGESDPAKITADHRTGEVKLINIGTVVHLHNRTLIWTPEDIWRELKKCDARCSGAGSSKCHARMTGLRAQAMREWQAAQ